MKPPFLCTCGNIVPAGQRCQCQIVRDRARKARHDQRRPSAARRGYDAEWRKARAEFLALFPYCRRCGAPATTVDHIKPHRGDDRLFWDRSNWQSLCTTHHSSWKQRQERQQ